MMIGVLALQGGFAAHGNALREIGHDVREVRTPRDLDGLGGLVLPGGESTTMLKLMGELETALDDFVRAGHPVLATFEGEPILVRQRNVYGATFHPELTADRSLHRRVFGGLP